MKNPVTESHRQKQSRVAHHNTSRTLLLHKSNMCIFFTRHTTDGTPARHICEWTIANTTTRKPLNPRHEITLTQRNTPHAFTTFRANCPRPYIGSSDIQRFAYTPHWSSCDVTGDPSVRASPTSESHMPCICDYELFAHRGTDNDA